MRRATLTLEEFGEILVRCSIVPPGMEVSDPNLTLSDLFIDSVGMLAIALEIEERYGVTLAEHDVPYLGTLGLTIEYVNRLIEAKEGHAGPRS
jgi:acyl carrier protein